MYQIIGVQSGKPSVVATALPASVALSHYPAAQKLFPSVIAPDGTAIDGFELNRRADAEREQSMPTGPKGQMRKADVIGNAVLIAKIATGEADDTAPDDGKAKPPKP